MSEKRIYMDNCVTTKPDPAIFPVIEEVWQNNFWYPKNFVSCGEEVSDMLASYQAVLAKTINSNPDEIHFTRGGTSANNIAIKGLIGANSDKGTHIICSLVDYPDILTNYAFFENAGYEVTYLEPDENGVVSADKLAAAIRKDTILFCTSWVNHVVGTIQPLADYAKVLSALDHKVLLHVDAGQAYGKFPIDVKSLGIDTMSVSAHKIHGPQGVGFLFKKQGTRVAQVVHGVARVDNLEAGGINTGLIAGFAKAAELYFSHLEDNIAYIHSLTKHLVTRVFAEIPDVVLNGTPIDERAVHNLNLSFIGAEGEAIMLMMDLNGVVTETGSACASQALRPNYVILAMNKNEMEAHGTLKLTLSKMNTMEEVDFVVDKIKEAVITLRKRSPLYSFK